MVIECSPLDDALHRDELGVLTRDDHFAGDALFLAAPESHRPPVPSLEASTASMLLAVLGDGRVHDALGVFGLPVVRPVFVNDLHGARRDGVLERFVLPVLEQGSVVVGLEP